MSSRWAMSKKEIEFVEYKYGKTDEEILESLNQKGGEFVQFELRIEEWLKNGKPMREVNTESGYDPEECFGLNFDSKDRICKTCSVNKACQEAYTFFVEKMEKEIVGLSKIERTEKEGIEDDKIIQKIKELQVEVDRSDSLIKIHTMPKMIIHTLNRDNEGKIVVYSSRGLLPYVYRWQETKDTLKVYKKSRISFRIFLSDLVDFIENMMFDPEKE